MVNEWTPARAGLAELQRQLGSNTIGGSEAAVSPVGGRQLQRWLSESYVLSVAAWDDPEAVQHGFEARSLYVERFWLPIVGPTCICAYRMLQLGGAVIPIPLTAIAGQLGIGPGTGTQSVVVRSLARLVEFRLARIDSGRYEVRTHAMPLSTRLRQRLPQNLQVIHQRFIQGDHR